MDNFLKDIKNTFFNIHKELIIKNIIPENLNYNNIYFDIPKNENHGDISTNALLIYNKYSSINIKAKKNCLSIILCITSTPEPKIEFIF